MSGAPRARIPIHALGIAGATAGIVLLTLLPFLPGTFDSLSVPVSVMFQILGKAGLLLVPVGALWVLTRYSTRLARNEYGIARAALIGSSVVWILSSLGALVTMNLLLAIGSIALGTCVIAGILPRLRALKDPAHRSTSPAAFYLLVVPLAVAVLQTIAVARAIEFSRNRAIRNSAPLISDIERYRAANGRYPESLMSVWPDYHPGLIGIREYHYEPRGEAYNLFFEQLALHVGTREFVMYNPRDQHAMTSHKMDRLQLSPEQLALDQTRGHNALHDTQYPHWKYFWFD